MGVNLFKIVKKLNKFLCQNWKNLQRNSDLVNSLQEKIGKLE